MKVVTVPGQTYVVYAAEGATITAPGVKDPLLTCEWGKPNYVTVPGGEMEISDPEATYAACRNFKRAALALGLLGGGNHGLPAGYTRLEFLESTASTSIIRTSYTDMRGCIINAKFFFPQSGRGGVAGVESHVAEKYTQNISINNINGYFMQWRFSKLHQWWNTGFRGWHEYEFDDTTDVLKVDGVVHGHTIYKQTVEVSGKPFCLMGELAYDATGEWTSCLAGMKCGAMKFTRPSGEVYAHFVPIMDNNGIPCMFDMVNKTPLYQKATAKYIAGLTMNQARKLGKNLPASGGALTVSLPTGYEQNATVAKSLETARAKGWTLTVQTYTPEAEATAATFGMRRVWVRRWEDEAGSYVDADGQRWQVEWCVDVVGADPESLGFERFRSVEAAREFWGLVDYVDPEAELPETELATIEEE